MLKKIISLLLVIFINIFFINYSNAQDTNTWAVLKAYTNFIEQIEIKLDENKQLVLLNFLSKKIELSLKSKNISTKSVILLKELDYLNLNKIFEIKNKLKINIFEDTNQIKIEQEEKQKLLDVKKNTFLPFYIKNLLSNEIKYLYTIYTKINPNFEFIENNKVYRIIITRYITINEWNTNYFNWKKWYVVNFNWNYIFVENYTIEEKIPYSDAKKHFKDIIYDPNLNYHLKDGNYYFYKFDLLNSIDDKYWFYSQVLYSLWIIPLDSLLYKHWNTYSFITKFREQKLISEDLIKNISNKKLFLLNIYNDKKTLDYDSDKYFIELKNISENLTKWLSKEEKINKIYNWLINYITYTNPIDLKKAEIFSWIDTYKNKDGVCEWYVKLMLYMLMFSWIEDTEVIRWFVINANDFPKIWHAWIKIWNYYYDPTFDDPIWNTKAKTFDEYEYYKLPADLLYTNRYDVNDLPEELKTKTKVELNNIVVKNLFYLIGKYKDANFNLMRYPLFLYNNWLKYDETITISKLSKIINIIEVDNVDFSFTKNWVKNYISKIQFYKISDENLYDILSIIKFDLTWKYLYKWNFQDWTYEYRIWFNVEFNK